MCEHENTSEPFVNFITGSSYSNRKDRRGYEVHFCQNCKALVNFEASDPVQPMTESELRQMFNDIKANIDEVDSCIHDAKENSKKALEMFDQLEEKS